MTMSNIKGEEKHAQQQMLHKDTLLDGTTIMLLNKTRRHRGESDDGYVTCTCIACT